MNKIQKTLVETIFKGVEVKGLIHTAFRYMIDSKYRKKVLISKYLEEQLVNVPADLYIQSRVLRGKTADQTIVNILKWVRKNYKYKRDKDNYGRLEYWANIRVIWAKKEDDCDGLNTLVYVMARMAGLSSDQLYCMIGDTPVGGHFWLTYWTPKLGKYGKVVAIDATYYPNNWSVKNRPAFRYSKKKYQNSWYIFNERICLRGKK